MVCKHFRLLAIFFASISLIMCHSLVHAQVATAYGVYDNNSYVTIANSPPAKAFYGNQCSNPNDAANCGGYSGGSSPNIILTQEASNLTLTSGIINQLNVGGSYT